MANSLPTQKNRGDQTAARTHPAAHYPLPNFEKCGNCGADASRWVTWDNADGWCCSKCGACDSDE